MNELDQLRFRIAVCLKVCNRLRVALERNGNRYDGRLVPNLTSVTDVLTIPFDILLAEVEKTPELRPDDPSFYQ